MKKQKILSQKKKVGAFGMNTFLPNFSKMILFVFVLFFISNNTHAQRGIFQEFTGTLNEAQQHYLNSVRKSSPNASYQVVTIDSEALISGVPIVVNLQDGRDIDLVPYYTEKKLNGKVLWKGDSGNFEGVVKFMVNGELITGNIRIMDAYHNVYPLSGGLHLLIPIESLVTKNECSMHGDGGNGSQNYKPERHVPIPDPVSGEPSKGNDEAPESLAAECKIRILAGYTEIAATNSADIVSKIEMDIVDFNDINSNSLVDFEVEIARIMELTGYTEVSTASPNPLMPAWTTTDNLLRFHNPSDGFMDDVHDLRNLYDADMCQIYADNLAGVGGVAMEVNVDAADAFSSVLWDHGNPLSPVHELGHLMGMWHNVESSPAFDNYDWEHGYYNDNDVTGTNFRTVMSYSSSCNGSCNRVEHWSNNDNTYLGLITGSTATHDNARIARFRDATVAGFQANNANKSVFQDDTVDDDEVADVYGSTSISTSSNTVIFESGSKGTYRAGERITLMQGFHAKSGTTFHARTEMACTNLNLTSNDEPVDAFKIDNHNHEVGKEEKRNISNLPTEISLKSYPNPFNVSTTIEYSIAKTGQVELVLYDMFGKAVHVLKEGAILDAGNYKVDLNGDQLAPGTYHCILKNEGETKVHKIILIK